MKTSEFCFSSARLQSDVRPQTRTYCRLWGTHSNYFLSNGQAVRCTSASAESFRTFRESCALYCKV